MATTKLFNLPPNVGNASIIDDRTGKRIGRAAFLTFRTRPTGETAGCAEWIKDMVVADTEIAADLAGQGLKGQKVRGCSLSSAKATIYTVANLKRQKHLENAFVLVTRKKKTMVEGKIQFVPLAMHISDKPFSRGARAVTRRNAEATCKKVLAQDPPVPKK